MAGDFEHHFRRTIPGDIDSVRRRLSDVLESFGYIVIGDAPIQAKRKRVKSIWVAMVLDYEVTLTIALKPISPASTLATFEYDIEQLFTRGEMQTLEREAEAIIALATRTSAEVFCASCGAENAGNARFCRVCGKPAAPKPATDRARGHEADRECQRISDRAHSRADTLVSRNTNRDSNDSVCLQHQGSGLWLDNSGVGRTSWGLLSDTGNAPTA